MQNRGPNPSLSCQRFSKFAKIILYSKMKTNLIYQFSVAGAMIFACLSSIVHVGSLLGSWFSPIPNGTTWDPALGMRFLSLASLLRLAWADCEASNLIQLPGTSDTVALGIDLHVKGAAVSFSSPEFSALLPKLDVKMNPMTASSNNSDLDC